METFQPRLQFFTGLEKALKSIIETRYNTLFALQTRQEAGEDVAVDMDKAVRAISAEHDIALGLMEALRHPLEKRVTFGRREATGPHGADNGSGSPSRSPEQAPAPREGHR